MLQTADADAKLTDTAEITDAATTVACGSSFFSSAVAVEMDVAEITVAAMTAVCGSSYFSSPVAAETF